MVRARIALIHLLLMIVSFLSGVSFSPPAGNDEKNEPLCQAVHGIYGKPAPTGLSEQPMIALHKKTLVTVRQIFSADPATGQQALPGTSAVAPFPFRSCTGFAGGTDGYRASIKRFNFDCILALMFRPVNCFFAFFGNLSKKTKRTERKAYIW